MNSPGKRPLKVSELTEGKLYYSLFTNTVVKVVSNDYSTRDGMVKRLSYEVFSPHFKDPIVVTNIKDGELHESI